MGKEKENGSYEYETNRDARKETGGFRRWKSGRRFRSRRYDEHERGYRNSGTHADGGNDRYRKNVNDVTFETSKTFK